MERERVRELAENEFMPDWLYTVNFCNYQATQQTDKIIVALVGWKCNKNVLNKHQSVSSIIKISKNNSYLFPLFIFSSTKMA